MIQEEERRRRGVMCPQASHAQAETLGGRT